LSQPIYPGFVGDYSGFVAHVEEASDGLAAIGAVIQGALVDVHSYERVSGLRVEVAGELHGVGQAFFAVIQGVLDAFTKGLRYGRDELGTESAADSIAS